MKYYIILQPSIKSMGGEEMYTRNIVASAQDQGYLPVVFHSNIGSKIYIDELEKFRNNYFKEFKLPPAAYSKRRINKIMNTICSMLPDLDEYSVIESHEIIISEWGELLAKKLHVRHLAYMLLEHNTLTNKTIYDFFRFKYNRRELVGIVNNTIPDMFAIFDSNIEGYALPAYCQNVLAEIPCLDKYKVGKADYTIGTIGRTNKEYVQPMITSILRFAAQHKDKLFNVLYIGGSQEKKSDIDVCNRLSHISNIQLTFTGMIYPLSIEMIRQMDVCIATAGSCTTATNCGIPTISMDSNDQKAIGIFGQTTQHSLFRANNEPQLEVTDLLEDVLIKKRYGKTDNIHFLIPDFKSHWDFVDRMTENKEYFNINNIKYSFKHELFWIIIETYFSKSVYNAIVSVLKIIKRF